MNKMFEGHEFIKLDSSGKYVIDITEYKLYEVTHNYKGEAVNNVCIADINPDGTFERLKDVPVRIIRKAKSVIESKMMRVKELESVVTDG